jgi:hypothetical protein
LAVAALLADGRAQVAEVFAEAPNGGLELRDAAQQDGSAEIGVHTTDSKQIRTTKQMRQMESGGTANR